MTGKRIGSPSAQRPGISRTYWESRRVALSNGIFEPGPPARQATTHDGRQARAVPLRGSIRIQIAATIRTVVGGSRIYRTSIVVSSIARQRENLKHGYHGYHRIEGQGDMAKTMIPTMATMATTNAAARSLDSIWTPRRHFHIA